MNLGKTYFIFKETSLTPSSPNFSLRAIANFSSTVFLNYHKGEEKSISILLFI
jgi:hypothetical protein